MKKILILALLLISITKGLIALSYNCPTNNLINIETDFDIPALLTTDNTPPDITYLYYIPEDSVFYTGPFDINATIFDSSGVDTAMLIYHRSGISGWDTIGMSRTGINFHAVISNTSISVGDSINYYIYARDASPQHNATTNPLNPLIAAKSFVIYSASVPSGCNSPVISFPFVENFDQNTSVTYPSCNTSYIITGWTNEVETNGTDWAPHSGTTISTATGPSADHTSGSGIYIFTESSACNNKNAIVTSPCLNILNLSNPYIEFWYHMYGASMGTLKLQIWNGTHYVDVWSKTGDRGNQWHKASVAIGNYKGIIKVRFNALLGPSFQSDIAVDDIRIYDVPLNDAGIVSVNLPNTNVTAGLQPVKVSVKNFGVNVLSSSVIHWKVNGMNQTPYSWTGLLPHDSVADSVTIGYYNFVRGPAQITVWSELPNGITDGDNLNDTTTKNINVCNGALHGNYTVGTMTSDFADIEQAVWALEHCGIDSAVVFYLAPGTYTQQITLNGYNGMSQSNTVTFRSLTGDPASVVIQYGAVSYNKNWVVRIHNADYFRFKKVTLKSVSITAYSTVLVISGTSSHNIIDSCIIRSSLNPSGGSCGIKTNDNNQVNYTTISNNKFIGGVYGCYLGTGYLYNKGNIVAGNVFINTSSYPLYAKYQDSLNVSGNFVDNCNKGFYIYNGKNCVRIESNKINLIGTSFSKGLYIQHLNSNYAASQDTSIIANNMISIVATQNYTEGISISQSRRTKILFNSVSIYSGNSTSKSFFINGASGIIIKNNIFYNDGGYAYYVFTPNAISKSDYNDYYTTGSYFAYWSWNKSNLNDLRAANGMDVNSVSVNPAFMDTTNLHSSSIALYGAGDYDSDVSTDIDGDLRSSTSPCIGADEFNYYSNDAGIVYMTAPGIICPGSNNVVVRVKNFGLNTLTSFTLNWKVNGVQQTALTVNNAINPFQTTDITIGSYLFNSSTVYDFQFWTTLPNGVTDSNNVNDTLAVSGFQTSLDSGTYTIGNTSSADFHSIYEAVNKLNTYGICGPVVFNIDTGTYYDGIFLDDIPGASPVNTVTFKSATGDSSKVIINYIATMSSTAAVYINDMSYVTIKGLTFNVSGLNGGRGVLISGNSDHNHIESCVFNMSNSNPGIFSGVFFNGSNVTDNILINNEINGGHNGVILSASYQLKAKKNEIKNNILNGFIVKGLYVIYQDSLQLSGNIITTNSTYSGSVKAIDISYSSGMQVSGNKINMTGTSQCYGIYLYQSSGTINSGIDIVNNMVVLNNVSAWKHAVHIYQSYYVNFVYNSVYVGGGAVSRGLEISGGNNIKVLNNIVYSSGVAYFFSSTGISASDYNDFHTDGNVLAMSGTTNLVDLAALKQATGKDIHSLSVNPNFAFIPDLHIYSFAINNMATPYSSVNVDFDGETRDSLHPDIGADEFTSVPHDVTLVSVLSPYSGCGDINDSVRIKVLNSGSQSINGNLIINYSFVGDNAVVSDTVNNIILSGDTVNITLPTVVNKVVTADSTYIIKVWSVLSGDTLNWNDTATLSFQRLALPSPPLPVAVTTVYGSSATLSASGQGTIYWYKALNSSGLLDTGVFVTPVLFDTTTYYCSVLGANGCFSNRVSDTVIVNGIPMHDLGISGLFVNSPCRLDTAKPVMINIYNRGADTVNSGLSVRYKIDNLTWTPAETVNISIAPDDTISYTFNSKANLYALTGLSFNIVAALSLSTDTFNNNDSVTSRLNMRMGGTYTIGNSNKDFPSINAAVNAIDSLGICGNVVFMIDSGHYYEQILLTNVTGIDSSNTITFKSVSNDSTDVVVENNFGQHQYVVKLDNASYYRFKSISFKTNIGNAIEISGSSSYNLFENCVIESDTGGTQTGYGIFMSGKGLINNGFTSNRIINGNCGVKISGTQTNFIKGVILNKNLIENFRSDALSIIYVDSVEIDDNIIRSGQNTINNSTAINLNNSGVCNINGNNIRLENQNTINKGINLENCYPLSGSRILVGNNMISIHCGNGVDYGILSENTDSTDYYYNSILMTGGNTDVKALKVVGSGQSKIINNIFQVNGPGKAYFIDSVSAVNLSDYNNYFTNGAVLAVYNGNNAGSLSDLQSLNGQDVHSLSVDAGFIGTNDLHTFSGDLDKAAFPLAKITTDIDGDLRDTLHPDIGADEFLLMVDAGVISILNPVDTIPHSSQDSITVRLYNYGTKPLDSVLVSYSVNSGVPVTELWKGQKLYQGDSADYTFSTKFNAGLGGNITVCAETVMSGDINNLNDKLCKSVYVVDIKTIYSNGMKLWQNIPNPASGKTQIRYEIPSGGSVRFEMVNAMGEKVVSTIEKKTAGVYTIDLDVKSLASGIYFYSIEFDGQRLTRQMIVNR